MLACLLLVPLTCLILILPITMLLDSYDPKKGNLMQLLIYLVITWVSVIQIILFEHFKWRKLAQYVILADTLIHCVLIVLFSYDLVPFVTFDQDQFYVLNYTPVLIFITCVSLLHNAFLFIANLVLCAIVGYIFLTRAEHLKIQNTIYLFAMVKLAFVSTIILFSTLRLYFIICMSEIKKYLSIQKEKELKQII